jgi:hypothetical protein
VVRATLCDGAAAASDDGSASRSQRSANHRAGALGWVLIVLGLIQLTGGLSLLAGNTFGRLIAIASAGLGAIGALLSIGGAYPWWSLAIFFLCVCIIHGIFIFGADERAQRT